MVNDDINNLRNIPIARLYRAKPTSRVVLVKCPFHNERTASLALYPDNSFHCFGCKKHGRGAIDFLVAMGGTFKEAIEELRKLG